MMQDRTTENSSSEFKQHFKKKIYLCSTSYRQNTQGDLCTTGQWKVNKQIS